MFATLEGKLLARRLRPLLTATSAAAAPPSAFSGGAPLAVVAEEEKSVEDDGGDVEQQGPTLTQMLSTALSPLSATLSTMLPSPFDLKALKSTSFVSDRLAARSRQMSMRGTGELSVFNSGPAGGGSRPQPGAALSGRREPVVWQQMAEVEWMPVPHANG